MKWKDRRQSMVFRRASLQCESENFNFSLTCCEIYFLDTAKIRASFCTLVLRSNLR